MRFPISPLLIINFLEPYKPSSHWPPSRSKFHSKVAILKCFLFTFFRSNKNGSHESQVKIFIVLENCVKHFKKLALFVKISQFVYMF